MDSNVAQSPDAGKDMTIADIQAEMRLIAVKMMDKGIGQPSAHLKIKENGFQAVMWSRPKFFGDFHAKTHNGETPYDAISATHAFLDALPDPATEGHRKFTRALADAVDIATEYALPDAMVAPVRAAIVEVNAVLLEGPK